MNKRAKARIKDAMDVNIFAIALQVMLLAIGIVVMLVGMK